MGAQAGPTSIEWQIQRCPVPSAQWEDVEKEDERERQGQEEREEWLSPAGAPRRPEAKPCGFAVEAASRVAQGQLIENGWCCWKPSETALHQQLEWRRCPSSI